MTAQYEMHVVDAKNSLVFSSALASLVLRIVVLKCLFLFFPFFIFWFLANDSSTCKTGRATALLRTRRRVYKAY